jgi:hypothetical protein
MQSSSAICVCHFHVYTHGDERFEGFLLSRESGCVEPGSPITISLVRVPPWSLRKGCNQIPIVSLHGHFKCCHPSFIFRLGIRASFDQETKCLSLSLLHGNVQRGHVCYVTKVDVRA